MSIKVRIYKEKDREQVIELIIAVLQEIFKKKLKNTNKLMNDLGNIKRNYKAFYVAEQGEVIVGTIAIKKEPDNIAKIKRFYVIKNYRRKGIGKKLMSKAIKFAVKNKYKTLILSTYPQMKDAVKFYRKNGFEEYKYKDDKQIFFKKKLKMQLDKQQTWKSKY